MNVKQFSPNDYFPENNYSLRQMKDELGNEKVIERNDEREREGERERERERGRERERERERERWKA